MNSQLLTIEKLRAQAKVQPGFTTDSMYSTDTAERIRNSPLPKAERSCLKVDLFDNIRQRNDDGTSNQKQLSNRVKL